MKPTDEQIRAEAKRYRDFSFELHLADQKLTDAFIEGANWYKSQLSEPVQEFEYFYDDPKNILAEMTRAELEERIIELMEKNKLLYHLVWNTKNLV